MSISLNTAGLTARFRSHGNQPSIQAILGKTMPGTISADAGLSVAKERQQAHGKVREADDTNVEAARFGPGALLDREVIVQLSKLRPMALASRLCFDYGLIAATILFCETFWHPGLYALAVMVIGARQAGIGSVALHDGVHRMLSKNRKLNDCGTLPRERISAWNGLSASFSHA